MFPPGALNAKDIPIPQSIATPANGRSPLAQTASLPVPLVNQAPQPVPLVQETHPQASMSQPIAQFAEAPPAPAAESDAMSGGMKAAIAFAVIGLLALAGAIAWILLQK
jgi:hypothetical protein